MIRPDTSTRGPGAMPLLMASRTAQSSGAKFARAVFHAYFLDDRDISKSETTIDLAADMGVDRDQISAALNDNAVKERLKTEVDLAIKKGVFGSPFIVVDGEPFWGADRLNQVEKWLETGGW